MSQYVETPTKTLVAGGAISEHLRVKLSSGELAVAGLTDQDLGVADRPAYADGDPIAVRLRSAQGTAKMVAATAITAGAPVYTAASGEISATKAMGAVLRGYAKEAATADGDIIEVQQVDATDDAGSIDMTAGGAIAANLRVKLSAGKLAAAGLADNDIGVLEEAAAADGSIVRVRLHNAPGVVKMTASEAIAVGADVYTAAAGKVGDTAAATSYKRGVAMEAAAADGDEIYVMQLFTNTAESA